MIRSNLKIAAVAAMMAVCTVGLAPALAAPCRNEKGAFIKCPPPKPGPAARCKDAKGKFAKCSAPGAVPAK